MTDVTSSQRMSRSAFKDLRTFETTCETYSVDSRILYNDIEQLSNKRFYYTRQLVSWSRWLSAAAVAAACVAGTAAYYQRAKIHRVWRLRNPLRVRQLSLLQFGAGGFSVCAVLFLISPIGFLRLHDEELRRTQQLDAVAVAALVQEQNFRTLAEWARGDEAADLAMVSSPSGGVADGSASVAAAAAAAATVAPQSVWREVVVDPTLLLTHNAVAKSKAQSGATEPVVGQGSAPSSAGRDDGDDAQRKEHSYTVEAHVEAAKQKMAVELLLSPSPATGENEGREKKTAQGSSGSDGGDGELSSMDATSEAVQQQQQRRTWSRTADEAELQAILAASAEMLECLVKEKTALTKRVF